MPKNIVALGGDGIGPEIMEPTIEILERLVPGELDIVPHLFGGAAIDATGDPFPPETLAACQNADAVLLGAVGGPKWQSADTTPEQGLLSLRRELNTFANIRPVKVEPALIDKSPLRSEIVKGTELLIVRELTGGAYFGERYTEAQIARIAWIAFELAQLNELKVTNVDKANVLEESKRWRKVVERLHEAEYADVILEHMLVDNAASELVGNPRQFEIILTDNLFGDILSDEAGRLTGSLGMLPSASLSETDAPGIFEPVHGSAPDIAGQGIANPMGMFLSAGLMLSHLGLEDEAQSLERAVSATLKDGIYSLDLGGEFSTRAIKKAVLERLTE